jgi:hypothetical protein
MALIDYSLYPQTTASAYAADVGIVIDVVVCFVVVFVFVAVKFLLP